MYYLVMLKSHGLVAQMPEEHLDAFKNGIEAGLAKGTLKAAYARVGGGTILIVDSPNNAQLSLELRKHFITDAEVVPLIALTDLLEAHIEHRQTGQAKV